MAQTRHKPSGKYTCHNTPGDGTGMTHFPSQAPWACCNEDAPSAGQDVTQQPSQPWPSIDTTPMRSKE